MEHNLDRALLYPKLKKIGNANDVSSKECAKCQYNTLIYSHYSFITVITLTNELCFFYFYAHGYLITLNAYFMVLKAILKWHCLY